MDVTRRERLIEKIQAQDLLEQRKRDTPLPVVSLEDFFDGNDDYGSIGCNLLESEHPGHEVFYSVLKAMRDRLDVQGVLVEISEVEDDQWPFSERVYVLTSAAQDTVAQWAAALHPDDVSEGLEWSKPPAAFPVVGPGVKVYAVWWD